MDKAILLTGAAGFIGSHTLISLSQAGYDCIVIDNLSNSSFDVIEKCQTLTSKSFKFIQTDLLDFPGLCEVFKNNKIEVVVHFAALKAVGDSVKFPLQYYHNNITGSINLLRAMKEFGVNKIIYSSSCTVYGDPHYLPLDEKHPVGNCTNPYGVSKFFVEKIIADSISVENGSYIHLRYFNPVGAHPSGIIGESPLGTPTNLFPIVADVAVGKRECVNVFGNTYKTPDGTGVRDYIHILDLAEGHTQAVKYILSNNDVKKVYNLGTGRGYSVLEVIKTYEKECNRKISYKFVEKREGDIAMNYADPALALQDLGWKAKFDLSDMCAHSWNYIKNRL